MKQTRQTFERIAQILKEQGAPNNLVFAFADWLGETNALFNTDRFLTACGLPKCVEVDETGKVV